MYIVIHIKVGRGLRQSFIGRSGTPGDPRNVLILGSWRKADEVGRRWRWNWHETRGRAAESITSCRFESCRSHRTPGPYGWVKLLHTAVLWLPSVGLQTSAGPASHRNGHLLGGGYDSVHKNNSRIVPGNPRFGDIPGGPDWCHER